MVFNNISPLAFKCRNTDGIKEANIIQALRELHLFVNKDMEDELGRAGRGKAILLVQSLSDSSRAILDNSASRNSNSLILELNLYTFDVEFAGLSMNFRNDFFYLKNAFSNSETIDYNLGRNLFNGESFYLDLFDYNRYSEVKQLFIDSEMNNNIIPSPKYYTNTHAHIKGEYEGPLNENDELIFLGRELIDKRTSIYRRKLNEWEFVAFNCGFNEHELVLENIYHGNSFNFNNKSEVNPLDISDWLFGPTAHSMIEGLIYAYDTSGKFKTNENPNSNSSVFRLPNRVLTAPFAHYQFKEKLNEDVKNVLDNLTQIGNMLEETHGNVDIYYAPNNCGDRLKIIFNDYDKDNQPLVGAPNKANLMIKGDILHSKLEDLVTLEGDNYFDVK